VARLSRIFGSANWKYAVGEVFLIVTGITIALAVNAWYSERADRATETEYLARLQIDLKADIENFTRFGETLETKAAILQGLLTESTASLMSRGAESLMTDLNYSAFTALPDSQSTTFEELQSTGNLALLQDLDQRDALSGYYSGFEHISAVLAQPRGPYREIYTGSLPGDMVYRWRVDGESVNSSELRRGLQKLLAHPQLESAVNTEISYAGAMAFYLRQYRSQAEELLELLDRGW